MEFHESKKCILLSRKYTYNNYQNAIVKERALSETKKYSLETKKYYLRSYITTYVFVIESRIVRFDAADRLLLKQ